MPLRCIPRWQLFSAWCVIWSKSLSGFFWLLLFFWSFYTFISIAMYMLYQHIHWKTHLCTKASSYRDVNQEASLAEKLSKQTDPAPLKYVLWYLALGGGWLPITFVAWKGEREIGTKAPPIIGSACLEKKAALGHCKMSWEGQCWK